MSSQYLTLSKCYRLSFSKSLDEKGIEAFWNAVNFLMMWCQTLSQHNWAYFKIHKEYNLHFLTSLTHFNTCRNIFCILTFYSGAKIVNNSMALLVTKIVLGCLFVEHRTNWTELRGDWLSRFCFQNTYLCYR